MKLSNVSINFNVLNILSNHCYKAIPMTADYLKKSMNLMSVLGCQAAFLLKKKSNSYVLYQFF